MKTQKNIKTLSHHEMNQIKGGGEVIYPFKDKIIVLPPPPPPPPNWRIDSKRNKLENSSFTN